jgi:hypothetical protein
MKSALSAIGAVILGTVVWIALFLAVEGFSEVVHPLPKDVSQKKGGPTMKDICQHVENYPAWILAVVVPMWGFIAFISTWTARRVGNFYSGAIDGMLLFTAFACNVMKLPYPMWFTVAILLVVPVAVIAGVRFGKGRKVAAA